MTEDVTRDNLEFDAWELAQRRKRRIALVVVGLVALAIVVGFGVRLWQRDAPRRTVVQFLEAMQEGDLERAAELAPPRRGERGESALVLAPGGTGITGFSIEPVRWLYDSRAWLSFTVEAGSHSYSGTFTVKNSRDDVVDGEYVWEDVDWYIADAYYPSVSVTFSRLGALELDGRPIEPGHVAGLGDSGITILELTPGVHTLSLADLGEFFVAPERIVTVPLGFSSRLELEKVVLDYELSEAGLAEVERLFREFALECGSSTEPVEDCPLDRSQFERWDGAVEGGDWEVLEWPVLDVKRMPYTPSWDVRPADEGLARYTWLDETGREISQERAFRFWLQVDADADGSLSFIPE